MPDPTLAERIAEMREIEKAATEAPWTEKPAPDDEDGFSPSVRIAATARGPRNEIYATPDGGSFPAADRAFIIAARSFVPRSLAALAVAQDALEEVAKFGCEGIYNEHATCRHCTARHALAAMEAALSGGKGGAG